MRAVFVLFDSLNRHMLGCYGGESIATPNFDRFSKRALNFDTHYVGSLPCMPARRDLHTGRLNFMHRSWGPLEPFDNSFAHLMSEAGVYSHLVTDHLHYFEDGGATYHTRYSSYDFIRGQEYDPWKAMVSPPLERFRERYAQSHYPLKGSGRIGDRGGLRTQHIINHEFMVDESDFPTPKCFASAREFLHINGQSDDWFLQIECFDPHEPFTAPERFKQPYKTDYQGGILDWPVYEKVTDSAQEIAEIRANYAAVVAMCDDYFGGLLDLFDAQNLWQDTALVVSTDHGFLLAEHDWWGKNLQPYYEEISHIPLLAYHPNFADRGGERVRALTQTFDLMPTFLELFGIDVPEEALGTSVFSRASAQSPERECGIFGMFGGPIGITDGHYTFYLYPKDLYAPGLNEYTLMPMHLNSLFSAAEMKTATLSPAFNFTKDMPVLKIDALMDARRIPFHDNALFQDVGTALYDVRVDPNQESPIRDEAVERRLAEGAARVLHAHDAPEELFSRYGLAMPMAQVELS